MKSIIKKWWFWLIMLFMLFIICFTLIYFLGINVSESNTHELARKVQSIDNDSTIYSSSGKKTLILELNNWSNNKQDKLNQMISEIKKEIKKDEYKTYKKFITMTYLESNNKSNVLFVKTIYNLPDFEIEEECSYIDFNEYKSMYSTLDKTMENYTKLFNSIY